MKIASTDLWLQEMFTFSEMLALVESESSFGAYVCHRRPGGSTAISDLVKAHAGRDPERLVKKSFLKVCVSLRGFVPSVAHGKLSVGRRDGLFKLRNTKQEVALFLAPLDTVGAVAQWTGYKQASGKIPLFSIFLISGLCIQQIEMSSGPQAITAAESSHWGSWRRLVDWLARKVLYKVSQALSAGWKEKKGKKFPNFLLPSNIARPGGVQLTTVEFWSKNVMFPSHFRSGRQLTMPWSLLLVEHLCLPASPAVWSTHDHCTQST